MGHAAEPRRRGAQAGRPHRPPSAGEAHKQCRAPNKRQPQPTPASAQKQCRQTCCGTAGRAAAAGNSGSARRGQRAIGAAAGQLPFAGRLGSSRIQRYSRCLLQTVPDLCGGGLAPEDAPHPQQHCHRAESGTRHRCSILLLHVTAERCMLAASPCLTGHSRILPRLPFPGTC